MLKYKILLFFVLTFSFVFSQSSNHELFENSFIDGFNQYNLGSADSAKVLLNQAIKFEKNSSAFYLLAKIYFNEQNYTLAFINSQKSVVIEPQNLWYQRLYFKILLKLNSNVEATKTADYILANTLSTDDYLDVLNFFSSSANSQKFYFYTDKFFNSFGYNTEIFKLALDYSLKTNDTLSFNKYSNEFIKISDNSIESFFILNDYLSKFNSSQKQKRILLKAFEIYPEEPLISLNLADVYIRKNSFDSSFLYLKTSILSNVDNSNLIVFFDNNKKVITSKNNIYLDSIINLADSVNKVSNNLNYILADLFFAKNSFYKAFFYYNRYLSQNPTDFNKFVTIFNLSNRLSLFKQLDSIADIAISIYPYQPYAFLFKSIALLQTNKLDNALTYLQQGTSIAFDDTALLAYFNFYTSQYYRLKNDKLNENKYLQLAENYSKRNCTILSFFALYLCSNNIKNELALSFVEPCLSSSANSSFQYIFAFVMYRNNKFDDALKVVNNAIANSDFQNFLFYELKGNILKKLNKTDEAQQFFNLSVELGNIKLNENL